MSEFLAGPAPGTVDPFSLQQLANQTQEGETATVNRNLQLGLQQPAGSPQAVKASGGNMPGTGQLGTPGQMDTGQKPSLVGGIPGMAGATLGQMETNAMNSPTGSGGKTGASILGNIF